MPSLETSSLPHPWKYVTEELIFQLGPWSFGQWRFISVSNCTSPLVGQNAPLRHLSVGQPITFQQMRDDGTIRRALSFDQNAIRYAAYRSKRYFVELSNGSFQDYLSKFSRKTRNTLRRKVRRFAEHAGGVIDWRYFASPEEMMKFREHAISISRLSYQGKIGTGFPESDEFRLRLIEEAANGDVCGFVLMHDNNPVAYVFCGIEADIMAYNLLAFDPKFAQFSPGTVLLFLILERLFAEQKFRLFDFQGPVWDYKALFGTGSVDYVRVIWFPITAKNIMMVTAHDLLRLVWQGVSRLKELSIVWKQRIITFGNYGPRRGLFQRDYSSL